MSERQTVEIDYCPQCRGVWLDRGELDKIIDRVAADAGARQPPPSPAASPDHAWREAARPRQEEVYYTRGSSRGHGYPKRKKSFLEELFD